MDTEYYIQSSVELGHITPYEAFCLTALDGAYRQVRMLVDEQLDEPRHFLQNTARYELAQAGEGVRYWVALRSLPHVGDGLRQTLEAAEHIVQKKVQRDLGVDEGTFALKLGALSPTSEVKLVRSEEDVTETTVRQILDDRMGDLKARFEGDIQTLIAAAHWYRDDNGESYRRVDEALARQRGYFPDRAPLTLNELLVLTQKEARLEQRLQKKARGAVKKVTKLFRSLGQEQNLRLFVSGGAITLSHPDSHLKFVLKPLQERGWLLERSVGGRDHTPYDLAVYTKDDVFISRLCLYVSASPVLDQVLALTLFIESGEEMDVLQKANWFSYNPQMQAQVTQWYPELAGKYPSKQMLDALDPVKGWLTPDFMVPPFMTRAQEHWEPIKGRVQAWIQTWMEPVIAPLAPLLERAGVRENPAATAHQLLTEVLDMAV